MQFLGLGTYVMLCTAYHAVLYLFMQFWYRAVLYLTITHKNSRVWGPGTIHCYSIWCTVCPPPPSWNTPWGTHEDYLCTNQCTLIQLNKAIPRSSGQPTVYWKEESDTITSGPLLVNIASLPIMRYSKVLKD